MSKVDSLGSQQRIQSINLADFRCSQPSGPPHHLSVPATPSRLITCTRCAAPCAAGCPWPGRTLAPPSRTSAGGRQRQTHQTTSWGCPVQGAGQVGRGADVAGQQWQTHQTPSWGCPAGAGNGGGGQQVCGFFSQGLGEHERKGVLRITGRKASNTLLGMTCRLWGREAAGVPGSARVQTGVQPRNSKEEEDVRCGWCGCRTGRLPSTAPMLPGRLRKKTPDWFLSPPTLLAFLAFLGPDPHNLGCFLRHGVGPQLEAQPWQKWLGSNSHTGNNRRSVANSGSAASLFRGQPHLDVECLGMICSCSSSSQHQTEQQTARLQKPPALP